MGFVELPGKALMKTTLQATSLHGCGLVMECTWHQILPSVMNILKEHLTTELVGM